MSATMNISLTEPLKRFVDEQVREGGFSSTSDYMRDLIRRQQRFAAEDKLRNLIAEGLASGPGEPLTPEFFTDLRKQVRARARARARRK